MKPLLTLLIAVHERPGDLIRSIQSLLDQTLDRGVVEVAVVAESLEDLDQQIIGDLSHRMRLVTRPWSNPTPRAVGDQVGEAISRAQGEWLGILDSGDELTESGLEELLSTAERTECDLAACRVAQHTRGEEYKSEARFDWMLEPTDQLNAREFPGFFYLPVVAVGRLYRTSFLQEKNIALSGIGENDQSVFATETALRADRINYSPTIVYRRRRSLRPDLDDQSSTAFAQASTEWVETCLKLADLHERYGQESYFDLRYDLDIWTGMQHLVRFASRLDASLQSERTQLKEILTELGRVFRHHHHADLANRSLLERALVTLIGDGLIGEAHDLVLRWRATRG